MKSTQPTTSVAGIDISKAKLDVAVHGSSGTFVVSNDPAGWRELVQRLHRCGVNRVGLEATGGYERGVVRQLRDAAFDVAVLQPLQVKAFGQLHLRRAKNDRLDAILIAACTHALGPHGRTPPDPAVQQLADHLTYVEQIEDDIARFKTRLEHLGDARQARTVRADIARLEKRRRAELSRLEARLDAHPQAGHSLRLLLSIPGIGTRTALALVLRLPEMAELSREQAAALAGLAPFVHSSGKRVGETHVGGGRNRLRRSLYMAAFAAAHHWNPPLKAFYQRLTQRGVASRSAIVACARKLLTYAITVIQRGTPWTEQPVRITSP